MSAPEPSNPACLARKTDEWFTRAQASLLGQVPCRPGCSHCCIGPFPITLLDVHLLQEGLNHLPPNRRDCIEGRARAQTTAMEAAYPQLLKSPFLDHWPDTDIDRLVSQFHRAPCPALGEDGLCGLYEHRPLTCRSMGIPSEQEGVTSGACEVQTFIPIVRLSASVRADEDELARQEAQALESCHLAEKTEGEDLLLPYGFLAIHGPEEPQEGIPSPPLRRPGQGIKRCAKVIPLGCGSACSSAG
jgi:Fe-S-cluster containining protein